MQIRTHRSQLIISLSYRLSQKHHTQQPVDTHTIASPPPTPPSPSSSADAPPSIAPYARQTLILTNTRRPPPIGECKSPSVATRKCTPKKPHAIWSCRSARIGGRTQHVCASIFGRLSTSIVTEPYRTPTRGNWRRQRHHSASRRERADARSTQTEDRSNNNNNNSVDDDNGGVRGVKFVWRFGRELFVCMLACVIVCVCVVL